jgi:prolipoprotein diacylglyceryltransferase
MHPYVGPFPGHVIGWIAGTLLASASAAWFLRRAGVSWCLTALSITSLAVSVYATAKLLLFAQAVTHGATLRDAVMQALSAAGPGTPGWILLTFIVGVPLARLLGLRFLHAGDVVSPAGGLLIFGGRIGCFLEGCCFGTPSSLPWALRFPIGSRPYRWQIANDLIWLGSPSSVPIHPLQLYFGGLGLLLFIGLSAYRSRKRYDGEMLLLFAVVYLWGTWLLEHLRAEPNEVTLQLELLTALAVTVLAAAMEWRRQVSQGSMTSLARVRALERSEQ